MNIGKLRHISYKNKTFSVRDLNTNKITEYSIYQFEYEYLKPYIKFLKNKISKLKYRRNNVSTKLENLDKPKHIVFGGKRKIKDLTTIELMDKKYKSFTVPD